MLMLDSENDGKAGSLPPLLRGATSNIALQNDTSEGKFRLLVQGTNVYALFLIDPDGRVASWNEGARRIFGYEEDEILGQPAAVTFTPEDRNNQAPEQELSTAMREGRAADVRWHLRKDGSRFWADGILERLTDEAGNFQGFAKVLRDATRDKEASDRLAESEEKYRTLFDSVDVGFCVIELLFDEQGQAIDYRFLSTNPAFERQSGLIEVVGNTMRQLVPNHDDFWFQWYGNIALTGKAERFENYAAAMGRWFDVYAVRVGLAEERKVAVLFTDITGRKGNEDALRRSEAQLRDAQARLEVALSAGNIATWTFDVVQNRVVADANLARLFSVDPVAAAGGELDVYLQAIHPDDRARVAETIQDAVVHKDDYEAEYRVVLGDGSYRWLVARGKVERDASGVAVALPGVVIDVTEQVQQQHREQFLVDFTFRTQTLTEPDAVIADAARSLIAFLQVSRCVFYEINLDADRITVQADFCANPSLPSVVGVLPLLAFGQPITQELKAGRNFVVDDVRAAGEMVPPDYAPAYEAVGARAVAAAPAVYSDRLVSGMSVHSSTPRHWQPGEVELLRTVVERTWLLVEVLRQRRALSEETEKRRVAAEQERRRLTDIFMRAPAFMTVLRGPEHRYERANRPYYQLIGRQGEFDAQTIIGKTVAEVIPEVAEQGFTTLLDQVYQTGESYTGTDTRVVFQFSPDAPPDEHFLDFTFQPLYEDDGTISGVLVHGVDLTSRKRLEQERERLIDEQQALLAEARTRAEHEALLNQISDAVRGSVDADAILQSAVAVLGQGLGADRCYFIRYDQTRDTARVSPEWLRDTAEIQPLVGRSLQMSPYSVNRNRAFTAGRTQAVNDVVAYDPNDAAPLLALSIRALLRVPIQTGTQMTALTVAMAHQPRDWTEDEKRLVENVAALLRSSLEAAHVQQRERNIAQQLQAALQPLAPENLPRLALEGYYRPALAEAMVGGDFYDVFSLDGNCTALVVGDLSGKGLAAASEVATVRNMLRYALYSTPKIAEAVTNLNHHLVEHGLLSGFSTLFVGVFDSQQSTLAYANCGQEQGLLWRKATGQVEYLMPTGPVMGGFDRGARFNQETVVLLPGDVLALFTDGLTEVGPSRKDLLEVEGVSRVLCDCCTDMSLRADPKALVTALIAGVDDYARGGVRDDIALLVGIASEIDTKFIPAQH